MIRMLLDGMLTDLGHTRGGRGRRDRRGYRARANRPSSTSRMLDVNLNGQPITPVVEVLVERGVPFVFASGYGQRGMPEAYRQRSHAAEAVSDRSAGAGARRRAGEGRELKSLLETARRAPSSSARRSYRACSGVTAMQWSSSAARSVPCSGLDACLARVGDPVIRIAAAVRALVDVQPLLPAPSQRRHRDALDLLGPAIGEIDIDQHVVPHALGEHAADDVGREAQAGVPIRRLAAARIIGLRQGERRECRARRLPSRRRRCRNRSRPRRHCGRD